MGGRYDEWKAREPEPEDDRLSLEPEPVSHCHDCGERISVGQVSVITDDGQSRVYCRPCSGDRRMHGWLFDARALAALRHEVA
jgi:hypothetical protein